MARPYQHPPADLRFLDPDRWYRDVYEYDREGQIKPFWLFLDTLSSYHSFLVQREIIITWHVEHDLAKVQARCEQVFGVLPDKLDIFLTIYFRYYDAKEKWRPDYSMIGPYLRMDPDELNGALLADEYLQRCLQDDYEAFVQKRHVVTNVPRYQYQPGPEPVRTRAAVVDERVLADWRPEEHDPTKPFRQVIMNIPPFMCDELGLKPFYRWARTTPEEEWQRIVLQIIQWWRDHRSLRTVSHNIRWNYFIAAEPVDVFQLIVITALGFPSVQCQLVYDPEGVNTWKAEMLRGLARTSATSMDRLEEVLKDNDEVLQKWARVPESSDPLIGSRRI